MEEMAQMAHEYHICNKYHKKMQQLGKHCHITREFRGSAHEH